MALGGCSSDWDVRQVSTGELAKAVEESIRWVDAEVEGDPLVRLLEIPAHFITSLWLTDERGSSVVIASLPEGVQYLNRLQQYTSQDFLSVLRQEPPVIGIRNKLFQSVRRDEQRAPELYKVSYANSC